MSRETLPPIYSVSADNHSAWVVVVSIVFLIYSILGITAKLLIRAKRIKTQASDHVLILGIVLLIIQTVLVIAACNNGLGRHIDTLDADSIGQYYKVSSFEVTDKESRLGTVTLSSPARIRGDYALRPGGWLHKDIHMSSCCCHQQLRGQGPLGQQSPARCDCPVDDFSFPLCCIAMSCTSNAGQFGQYRLSEQRTHPL